MTKPPTSYTGTIPSVQPQAQVARIVEVNTPAKRTHLDTPQLTVNPDGWVFPNAALCRLLDIGHGSPIELEPPRFGRSRHRDWYLDLRKEAPGILTHTGNTRPQFKTQRLLHPQLFVRQSLLVLELHDLYAEQTPGYYRLRRVAIQQHF